MLSIKFLLAVMLQTSSEFKTWLLSAS